MSDTDDTDNLLIIPPDLFTVHSDPEDETKPFGPYYKVVDSLITQVKKLENRIDNISAESSIGNSIDNITENLKSSKFMSAARKYSSLEDLPRELQTKSAQSTPQKSKPTLSSLPNTPNIRYSPEKSKSRFHYDTQIRPSTSSTQHDMLNEIDTFISNVKTIQKFQTARNLALQFSNLQEENLLCDNALNLKDVDKMLDTVESQKRIIESRLNDNTETENMCVKESTWQAGDTVESVPNRDMGMRELLYKRSKGWVEANKRSLPNPELKNENAYVKEKTWQAGDFIESVPNRDMGMRELLYKDSTKNSAVVDNNDVFSLESKQKFNILTTRPVAPRQNLNELCTESEYGESPSLSTESTQTTAYHTNVAPNKIHSNAAQVLNNHKRLLSHNAISHSAPNERMPSLYTQRSNYSLDSEILTNKNLVFLNLSDLWNSSGDLTNADRVRFINKLQEEKLRRQHCENLIHNLQIKMLDFQERIAVAVQVDKAKDEAISQIHKSWEESVSRIDDLCNKNSNLEEIIVDLKKKLSEESVEMAKKVDHYEKETSKALNLAHSSHGRLETLEKENNVLTTQLQSLEKQYMLLENRYSADQENVRELSKRLNQKENELSESKSILADARKEVSQSKKAVEICQTELTSMRFTQEQLEHQLNEEVDRIKEIEKEKKRILIDIEAHKKIEKALRDELSKQKEKGEHNKLELRNFYQDQVEVVVREKLQEFQLQLEKAESSLQEELHNRELAIAKSAAMHIQHITEKHALEIHLLEEKHKEEIKLYTLQLSKSKQQIESLQTKFQHHQDRKSNIAQQLHKVMETQWLEALKIINTKSPVSLQDKSINAIDQLNSLKSKSYNNVEEILLKEDLRPSENDYKQFTSPKSFDDDSVLKVTSTDATPLTSRPQKTRHQLDQEMQNYIQMLLNKSPRNTIDEQHSKRDKSKSQSPESSEINSQNQNNYAEGTKSSKMGYRGLKPPWK